MLVKNIILITTLFLLSCGKKNNFKPIKTIDFDGDQILNQNELNETEKYIARFNTPTTVTGTIEVTLNNDHNNTIPIKFTSKSNITQTTYNLIKSPQLISIFDHFSEFELLNLSIEDSSKLSNFSFCEIVLNFDSSSEIIEEILMKSQTGIKMIDPWIPTSQISISKEELIDLISKKAFLMIKRKKAPAYYNEKSSIFSEISKKSYRVYFINSNEEKIFYISNNLKIDDFIKSNGLSTQLESLNLGTLKANIGVKNLKTWIKKIDNKNYIIINDSADNILKSIDNYSFEEFGSFSRINGKVDNEFKKNIPSTQFLSFNFKVNVHMRDFRIEKYHASVIPDIDDLVEQRIFGPEYKIQISEVDLFNKIKLFINNREYSVADLKLSTITKLNCSDSLCLTLSFLAPAGDYKIKLTPIPESNYLIDGIYSNPWDPSTKSRRKVTPESRFEINYKLNAETI